MLGVVKLKLLPKVTPQEDAVSLYQSILFAGRLQHTVGAIPSAQHSAVLHSPGCSLHTFPLPFCPAAPTGVSRDLPQVSLYSNWVSARWGSAFPGSPIPAAGCCLCIPEGRTLPDSLPGWWFQGWPWKMLLIAGFQLTSGCWALFEPGSDLGPIFQPFPMLFAELFVPVIAGAKQEQLFHVSVKNWELKPEIARDLYYFSVKGVCSAFLRNHILLKCLGLATRVPFRGLDRCSQINIYLFLPR